MNTEANGRKGRKSRGMGISVSWCQEDLTIHKRPGLSEGNVTHTHAYAHTTQGNRIYTRVCMVILGGSRNLFKNMIFGVEGEF